MNAQTAALDRTRTLSQTQARWRGYIISFSFVLPALALYIVFVLYPFGRTFYMSLTEWNGFDPDMTFVGLRNYIDLTGDALFWSSLRHNLIWIVVGSAGAIGLGLFLAMLVSQRPRGFLLFRTVYFMPQVLGPAIVGVIWSLVYAPRRGFFYRVSAEFDLEFLRRSPIANTDTALYGIIVASIWASIGFYFVIFLAGLQNVDRDLLDAAKVDGANSVQRFWYVTIPQLSHVITMVISLSMIGSMKVFDIVWTMTQGGPANSSEVLGSYAYQESFFHNRYGYGSAIIMVTSALAMIMSVTFIRLRERKQVV